MTTRATIENMRANPGSLAFSPVTGEQYSANPHDYFALAEQDCLKDDDGNDMELVHRVVLLVPVGASVMDGYWEDAHG